MAIKPQVFLIFVVIFTFLPFPALAAPDTRAATLTVLTDAVYDELGSFSEGMIWARNGNKFIYLKENGDLSISSATLELACEKNAVIDVRDFQDGLAAIYTESRVYYIDAKGRAVTSFDWRESADDAPASADYEDIRPENQGLIPVKQDGKWGFAVASGKIIIPPQFDDFIVSDPLNTYQVFHEGLAAVKIGTLWGYINTEGQTVIDFEWDYADIFSEGCAVVGTGGKYGYINAAGSIAIPPRFTDANPFCSGAALVCEDGAYRLISPSGQTLSPKTWGFSLTVSDVHAPGLYLYQTGRKWGIAKLTVSTDPLDSAGAWAKNGIAAALKEGYVPDPLQEFYTQPVTRAEFVTLTMRWLEYKTGKSAETLVAEHRAVSPVFSDTDDPLILAAAALGIVTGSGGHFTPDGVFNREQAAVLLFNILTFLDEDLPDIPQYGYTDLSEASAWAQSAIIRVSAAGVMSGTGGSYFSPKLIYTREQSIVTYYQMK